MGNINNQSVNVVDNYTKADWEVFLKQGAFRGLKINKLSRHLAKSDSFTYDQNTHEIDLKYKNYKSINVRIEKLLKKNDRWTISRLIHNIRMWFPDSKYAVSFNDRISKLAAKIHDKPCGLDDLPNETQQIVFKNVCNIIERDRSIIQILTNVHGDSNVLQTLNNLLVSKNISQNIAKTKYAWINDSNVCLKILGCKNSREAVQYVLDRKLTSANFSGFGRINDVNLDVLIQGKPKLTKLSIHSGQISGDKLAELIEMNPNLQVLKLRGCAKISGDRLSEVIAKLPQLKILDLEYCSDFSFNRFMESSENFEMEKLNLKGFHSHDISFEKLSSLLDRLSKIKNIKVQLHSRIPEETLFEIIKKLASQKDLNFAYCSQISDEKFGEILEIHSELKVLNLDMCTQISEVKFLENAPNLESLCLRGCTGISEVEILKVPIMLQNLIGLDISQCPQISEETIAEMTEKFPKLKLSF